MPLNPRPGFAAIGRACLVAFAAAGLLGACSNPPPPASASPKTSSPVAARPPAEPVGDEPFDRDDQIAKLGQLRDKGLISEDEFQARRARLLKRDSP